jgi:predicted alpha/beta hydrolase
MQVPAGARWDVAGAKEQGRGTRVGWGVWTVALALWSRRLAWDIQGSGLVLTTLLRSCKSRFGPLKFS